MRKFAAAGMLLAVLAVLPLAGCGAGDPAAQAPTTTTFPPAGTPSPTGSAAATIVIKDFAFEPSTLTVAPGTRVTVEDEDSAVHTVSALNGAFDTGNINGASSATFTAPSAPGSYDYICMIHQFMHGSLKVS